MRSRAELATLPDSRTSDFVRAAMALALAPENGQAAIEHAERRWGARVASITKGAVAALTTDGSSGGADLVAFAGAARAFFAAVAERTIIGRLGLRRVPFHVKAITALGGAAAFWVGQGEAKPLTSMVYTGLALARLKTMGLAVLTRELLESSEPEAEVVIRAELERAVVAELDAAFIDPDNDGVDDVYPAAVTAGLVPISGTDDPTADLKALLGAFGGDLASAFLVMRPELAVGISGPAYPRIGARGGEMAGIPAVTSRNVPAGVMALVDPAGIALAEGEGEVRTLAHGDVLMADDPTMASAEVGSPPSGPTAATLVNLWQVGAVAILAGRWINWATVRPGSVALLTGAAYGDAEGLP